MSPDFEGFARFLVRRRQALGFENPAALRQSTAAVQGIDDQTLRNVEESGKPSFNTFLWLPEIYKVGLLEMFRALYPDWEHTFDADADLLSSSPSMRQTIWALSKAPDDIRQFVDRGLGSAGSVVGVGDGNNDGASGGSLRARRS